MLDFGSFVSIVVNLSTSFLVSTPTHYIQFSLSHVHTSVVVPDAEVCIQSIVHAALNSYCIVIAYSLQYIWKFSSHHDSPITTRPKALETTCTPRLIIWKCSLISTNNYVYLMVNWKSGQSLAARTINVNT